MPRFGTCGGDVCSWLMWRSPNARCLLTWLPRTPHARTDHGSSERVLVMSALVATADNESKRGDDPDTGSTAAAEPEVPGPPGIHVPPPQPASRLGFAAQLDDLLALPHDAALEAFALGVPQASHSVAGSRASSHLLVRWEECTCGRPVTTRWRWLTTRCCPVPAVHPQTGGLERLTALFGAEAVPTPLALGDVPTLRNDAPPPPFGHEAPHANLARLLRVVAAASDSGGLVHVVFQHYPHSMRGLIRGNGSFLRSALLPPTVARGDDGADASIGGDAELSDDRVRFVLYQLTHLLHAMHEKVREPPCHGYSA